MSVSCILCGKPSSECRISVGVGDGILHCNDCDGSFSVEDVEQHLAEWSAVLPWLKSHPARRAEPQCVKVAG